jgi:hypothetical protein
MKKERISLADAIRDDANDKPIEKRERIVVREQLVAKPYNRPRNKIVARERLSLGRVQDKAPPHAFGKVLQKGDQVSEVLWDNGKKQYVNNDFLLFGEEPKQTRKQETTNRVRF